MVYGDHSSYFRPFFKIIEDLVMVVEETEGHEPVILEKEDQHCLDYITGKNRYDLALSKILNPQKHSELLAVDNRICPPICLGTSGLCCLSFFPFSHTSCTVWRERTQACTCCFVRVSLLFNLLIVWRTRLRSDRILCMLDQISIITTIQTRYSQISRNEPTLYRHIPIHVRSIRFLPTCRLIHNTRRFSSSLPPQSVNYLSPCIVSGHYRCNDIAILLYSLRWQPTKAKT